MNIRFDTITALHRQTDRQTDRRTDRRKYHNNITLRMVVHADVQ